MLVHGIVRPGGFADICSRLGPIWKSRPPRFSMPGRSSFRPSLATSTGLDREAKWTSCPNRHEQRLIQWTIEAKIRRTVPMAWPNGVEKIELWLMELISACSESVLG